jgi:hypothetical protein
MNTRGLSITVGSVRRLVWVVALKIARCTERVREPGNAAIRGLSNSGGTTKTYHLLNSGNI